MGSAEGKDRAIAELRPVMAPVPASVLRDELLRKSAGALGVPEARLVTLLGQEQPATVSSYHDAQPSSARISLRRAPDQRSPAGRRPRGLSLRCA